MTDDDENIEERYIPVREPWLSAWCWLHSLHLEALKHLDDPDSVCLRAAVHIADAKYKLYLGSIGDPAGANP